MVISILNNKKCISPVVATALLLVVAVVSTIGFQGWFTNFSDNIYVDVEQDSSANSNLNVEALIGDKLYINSGENVSVSSIKINNFDCNFSGSISGVEAINISNCINNVSGPVDVVVVTDKRVIESYEFVDSNNNDLSVSQVLNIVGYESNFGQWIGNGSTDEINGLVLDSSGNIYISGSASSEIYDDNLGVMSGNYSGAGEIFLIKFDPIGTYLWGQWIGGSSDDTVNDMKIDSNNNIYLAGYVQTNVTDDGLGIINGNYSSSDDEGFVFKFDSSGTYLWGQWLGSIGGYEEVNSISIDSNGDVYVVGYFESDNLDDITGSINGTYSGGIESYLFKFDSSGTYLWGQWIGGTNDDSLSSVFVDPEDNIYIGGNIGSNDLNDGLGSISGTFSNGSEGLIFKFDSDGNYLWGQFVGSINGYDDVGSIFATSENVYFGANIEYNSVDDGLTSISGTFSGVSHSLLAKFDSNGTYQWAKWLGGDDGTYINSLFIDSNEDIFVTGSTYSAITGDDLGFINGTYTSGSSTGEGFIFKFNSSGDYLWGQWLGGPGEDLVSSTFVDSSNNLYIAYSGSDSTDDNLQNLSGNYSGQYEGLFLKFTPIYE